MPAGRPRTVSYERAAELRAKGFTYGMIARALGCSRQTAWRATSAPARDAVNAGSRARNRARREPCTAGCGTLVYQHRGRTGLCANCLYT